MVRKVSGYNARPPRANSATSRDLINRSHQSWKRLLALSDSDTHSMDVPLHFDDIRAAHARISPFINQTPVLPSAFFSSRASSAAASAAAAAAPINLILKAECLQKTGSFKIRGATNAVRAMIESGEITPMPNGSGVVTHSSGNHGQALAAAAAASNVKCVVVVPEGSPAVKANAARDYGADVVYCAPNLASRERVCAEMQVHSP
jgi:threonine dehydratase